MTFQFTMIPSPTFINHFIHLTALHNAEPHTTSSYSCCAAPQRAHAAALALGAPVSDEVRALMAFFNCRHRSVGLLRESFVMVVTKW